MRKKFVFYFIAPALAFAMVVYLFADRWMESGLEYAGEKIVGARVEIDNLRVTVIPVGIELSRLRVANPRDPWKNIFETGRMKFAFDFGQLLRSKFIIETVEVNNLILGTKRSTDGTIATQAEQPPGKAGGAPAGFSEQAKPAFEAREEKKTPVFDVGRIRKELKIDSLLNVHNLKTVQYLDSLKKQVQQVSNEWQTTTVEIEQSKRRLVEIETSLKTINVSEIKSIESATAAANTAKNALDNLNQLNRTFVDRRNAINNQIGLVSTAARETDRLAREDFQTAVNLARLPDVSMRGLAELILGKEIFKKANDYMYWVDFARKTVPKYVPRPEKEKPRRFEGQNIRFPEERSTPKLWIKKILFSGGTDQAQDPQYFYAKGEVHDIASDQRVTGQALTVALSATKGVTTSLAFHASFDRRKDTPADEYHAKLAGLTLGDFALGQSDFLPGKITQATAAAGIDVTVPGSRFDASTNILLGNVAIVFESQPRNDVERIVRDVLQSIKSFAVRLRMWNVGEKFDVALETDLDDQIAARAKKVVGDEIARIQNELRAKVNEKIAEKRREFETLFNEKKDEINNRLKSYETVMNQQLTLAESKKKELEARAEEEKKKQTEGIKKKAEETIKGFLKKH